MSRCGVGFADCWPRPRKPLALTLAASKITSFGLENAGHERILLDMCERFPGLE